MHRTRSHTSGAAYGGRVDALSGARPIAHSASSMAHAAATVKSQECHICLEDLRQDLAACPCGHVYHEMCILQAMEVNAQCPICRRQANGRQLIRLYFDVPADSNASGTGTATISVSTSGDRYGDSHTAALNDRVAVLIDRLQWQKKQHEMLLTEMKRLRHQSEQLLTDKQTLMQRVTALEMNKNELLSKVAKYQVELSRQAEASRQMALNQSIINYLNTCDGEALEEEVQNPRELIAALKKACKFRHDQYQKVVKEKMRLKAMLQGAGPQPVVARKSEEADERAFGKARLKSPMENKRVLHAHDYAQPPHEMKKRRVTISPPPAAMNTAQPAATSPFVPRAEPSSAFRANAYTDVAVRPMAPRAAPFGRSSYNPSQYGAYNITPSNEPPVQALTVDGCLEWMEFRLEMLENLIDA
ncbi:hypothetical protein ATCC90586_005202 [Pythium insidiosum]|nr:hypothetical protein ATCC90586_005202 [Pythium insidiosum]